MQRFNGSNQQEYCHIDNLLGEILGYIHDSSTYSTFQRNLSHVWFTYLKQNVYAFGQIWFLLVGKFKGRVRNSPFRKDIFNDEIFIYFKNETSNKNSDLNGN